MIKGSGRQCRAYHNPSYAGPSGPFWHAECLLTDGTFGETLPARLFPNAAFHRHWLLRNRIYPCRPSVKRSRHPQMRASNCPSPSSRFPCVNGKPGTKRSAPTKLSKLAKLNSVQQRDSSQLRRRRRAWSDQGPTESRRKYARKCSIACCVRPLLSRRSPRL
jgi:hypothetical protein